MEQSKKGSKTNLTCDVCKIDFNSSADHALHEFSKKHCDNLIRLAKQKPIVSKQKAKSEISQVEKEPPKVNLVTHTGSFAKYGYFVPGEIYANAETSKEFNTDYDPYLQKFAENPFKEKPNVLPATEITTFSSVSSFSKRKKKKIKMCQVCNVTLSTVPEYEAHMKSPQHIWKLKVTGMGVSAHFVKASSDLHTTDINEEPKPNYQAVEQIPVGTATNKENPTAGPFPLLYCSDCELLLNSPQQYNAHINGKSHIECAQRKAELKAKKEKLENPSPNQLYCYSCKISLNNLFQYNEHKNGKKHKTKCRNLIRKGITIPPEERVPGIPLLNPNRPVVYPELYEKLILEKQKASESGFFSQSPLQDSIGRDNFTNVPEVLTGGSTFGLNYHPQNSADIQGGSRCLREEKTHVNSSEKSIRNLGVQGEGNSTAGLTETQCNSESLKTPKIIFHKSCTSTQADGPDPNCHNKVSNIIDSQIAVVSCQKDLQADSSSSANKTNEMSKRQITIISNNMPVKCSICNESFQWQNQLDVHLNTEDHLQKILQHKLNGRSENDILNVLFSDRNVIKPNNLGKLTCSICSVTADNGVEFDQHLNSIVHKYTQKDYKMKRTLEVKHILASNEENVYFCKLCREGWLSLVDYTQHLHFVKHKSIQRAQRAKAVLAKRRSLCIQKPRLLQSLKKRNLSLKRVKTGKNPGVRTKVCGVAVDLNSGAQAPVPNLEPLEPKIDLAKNVSIGVCGKTNDDAITNDNGNNGNDKVKVSNVTKRYKITRSNRKSLSNQQRHGRYHDDAPPFVPNMIPPLMPGPQFYPRFPRPRYATPNRNWVPFSSPYPTTFGPYCNRPGMENPYVRPPWFQRPPWPRYR